MADGPKWTRLTPQSRLIRPVGTSTIRRELFQPWRLSFAEINEHIGVEQSMQTGRITVVLPTYRRPGPLLWSIVSVLGQTLPAEAASPASLVIVNNNGPRGEVDAAVERALMLLPESGWSVRVIHRDTPLFPVMNWYESIREFSASGDLVFLHGDDDLMLPGTLARRFTAFADSDATIQLCGTAGVAFFREVDDGAKAILRPPLVPNHTAAGDGTAEYPHAGESSRYAPLISCHAYRNGDAFWRAYDDATAAFRQWVGAKNEYLGLLPYALPLFEGAASGIQRIRLDAVYRGMELSSVYAQGRGASGWNVIEITTAFLLLLESPLFSHRRELDPLRRDNALFALSWFSRGLSPGARELVGRYGYRRLLGHSGVLWALARGTINHAREKTGLNMLAVRRDASHGKFSTLADLVAIYGH